MSDIEMDDLVRIEIEREGTEEIIEIALDRDADMLSHIRAELKLPSRPSPRAMDRAPPRSAGAPRRACCARRRGRPAAKPRRRVSGAFRDEHS